MLLMYLRLYAASPLTWFFFLIGLVIGSFLNVCIFRIPEKTFWKSVRSCCTHCQQSIPWYLNIPLLSYLLLRGKSQCCDKRISPQYPLVELFTGCLFVFIYWRMPFLVPSNGGWEIYTPDFLRFLHATIFCCLMLVCSVIDFRLMIIPDVLSLGMIALTPVVAYLHPDLDGRSAGIGIVAGGLGLYLISWCYWLLRREIGLGMGDVKLLAAIGGWLGYQALFPTVVFASVLGTVFGITGMIIKRSINLKSAIPFGPFLAVGAFLHFMFGHVIQEWIFSWSIQR